MPAHDGTVGPLLAQAPALAELLRDPILGVACVLLIVVSIEWIVVTRLIVRVYKRAALRRGTKPRLAAAKAARDIWSYPP